MADADDFPAIDECDGGDADAVQMAVAGDRPVLLRGIAATWPAVVEARKGDAAIARYLADRDCGKPVTVLVAPPEVEGRYFYAPDMRGLNFRPEAMPMRALLDRLLAAGGAPDAPSMYAGSTPTADSISGFASENRLLVDTHGVDPRIWVGNASRIAPHYDMATNVAVVVAGRRRFTLFPPDQIANLYVGPVDRTVAGQPTSMVNLAHPDLDRFPRFAEALAHARVADLSPGDAIYMPPMWWHHVRAEAPLNVLVNYWFGQPADRFPFAALMLAVHSIRELPDGERTAWRNWFDHYVFGAEAAGAVDHLPEHVRGVLGTPSAGRDAMILNYVIGMCGTDQR